MAHHAAVQTPRAVDHGVHSKGNHSVWKTEADGAGEEEKGRPLRTEGVWRRDKGKGSPSGWAGRAELAGASVFPESDSGLHMEGHTACHGVEHPESDAYTAPPTGTADFTRSFCPTGTQGLRLSPVSLLFQGN